MSFRKTENALIFQFLFLQISENCDFESMSFLFGVILMKYSMNFTNSRENLKALRYIVKFVTSDVTVTRGQKVISHYFVHLRRWDLLSLAQVQQFCPRGPWGYRSAFSSTGKQSIVASKSTGSDDLTRFPRGSWKSDLRDFSRRFCDHRVIFQRFLRCTRVNIGKI